MGVARRCLLAETRRASPTDRFPVEPPSEMVTLFLLQDTRPHASACMARRGPQSAPCLAGPAGEPSTECFPGVSLPAFDYPMRSPK